MSINLRCRCSWNRTSNEVMSFVCNESKRTSEISSSRHRSNCSPPRCSKLKKENQELRQQMSLSRSNPSIDHQHQQQVDLLKQMVRSTEEALAKERAQTQKSAHKKADDYRLLNEQIDSLKTSERHLKSKVRSLTNEIALLKRQ